MRYRDEEKNKKDSQMTYDILMPQGIEMCTMKRTDERKVRSQLLYLILKKGEHEIIFLSDQIKCLL